MYAYYRANAQLLGNITRDMAVMPERPAASHAFAAEMMTIAGRWGPAGRSRPSARGFGTWQSLAGLGLTEAVGLMVGFVESTASKP